MTQPLHVTFVEMRGHEARLALETLQREVLAFGGTARLLRGSEQRDVWLLELDGDPDAWGPEAARLHAALAVEAHTWTFDVLTDEGAS